MSGNFLKRLFVVKKAHTASMMWKRSMISAMSTAQDVLRECGDVQTLSQLKNGFRVATHNNGRQTATVGIWIDAGSRYESPENNGVASLWEHMIYSGTQKRGSKEIQNELAKIGAELRSYTSREHTAYFVSCLSSDVERAVEILANCLRETKVTDGKVEEYKKLLAQKLEESDQDYRRLVLDNLHLTAFQGTPLALSPLGTSKSLDALTTNDVLQFVADSYKPVRMVMTGVGGVEHNQIEKMAEKYFGDLSNEYDQRIVLKEPCRFTGSEFHFRDDDIPYMYGAVGIEGVPRNHVDFLALQVLNAAMGSWDHTHAASMNSPNALVQKICTEPEIVAFESFNYGYDTAGLLGYYLVAYGRHISDTTDLFYGVQREWRHWATGVTAEEVDRAKNKLKTNLFLALESNANAADHIATEVLCTGKITSFAELERRLTLISRDSICHAVQEHIYDRDVAIAGVGKTEAFPSYYHLRYAMSWWKL